MAKFQPSPLAGGTMLISILVMSIVGGYAVYRICALTSRDSQGAGAIQ